MFYSVFQSKCCFEFACYRLDKKYAIWKIGYLEAAPLWSHVSNMMLHMGKIS